MAGGIRGRVRRDDLAGRRQRADAILAAAAELIERWGYDKTTVDDIATTAGVAKGTIYLHWKTREALFLALLRRERVAMLADVRQALADDPEPASPRTLFRQLAVAIHRRPLIQAVLLQDMAVLGRLADQRRPRPADVAWRAEFIGYLEALRSHGALREDWKDRDVMNLISVTFMGSFVGAGLMPDEYQLTTDERSDLVAETIQRTIDSGRRLGAKATKAVAQATTEYVDHALVVARQQLDDAMDGAATEKGFGQPGKEDA